MDSFSQDLCAGISIKNIYPSNLFFRLLLLFTAIMVILSAAGCSRNIPPFGDDIEKLADELFSEKKPQNLLLITVDTLRADHLGCYGNKSIQTPNIDALADQGILFQQAFTPVPLTLPSHASILTGLYPPAHKIRDNGYFILDDHHQTLAEILKKKGYVTGAVVAAFVLNSRFGLDQGFDFYEDTIVPDPNCNDPFRYERRADSVVSIAEDWLSNNMREKFFLWLHFFDPHESYDPPGPYKSAYAHSLYDGEIAFTDACLGQLFKKMEELKIRENTLIVLTSDHGEGLGEHEEKTHSIFTYDTTLHVPLIINAPGLKSAGKSFDFLVRTIDIFPTALGLMGLAQPGKKYGQGINVIPRLIKDKSNPGLLLYCESLYTQLNFGWSPLKGIRSREWKYIKAPAAELYQVSFDPEETNNLYANKTRLAHAWEKRLQKIEKAIASTEKTKEPKRAPNLEVRKRLESLGYLCAPRKNTPHDTAPIDPKDMIQVIQDIDRGQALYAQGKLEPAAQQFEKTLTIDSGNIFLHYQLGGIYKKSGDYSKALGHYRIVLQEQEDYLEILNIIGSVYDRLGKYEQALNHFKRAAFLYPDQPRAYHNMGIIYIKTSRFTKAEKSFLRALALSQNNDREKALNYKCLGDTYLRLEELPKARQFYQLALSLRPGMVEVYLELAKYYTAKRQYPLAIPQWETAVALSPQDAQAHFTLGQCYFLTGEREKAGKSLQQCLQIKPDLIQARRFLEKLNQ